MADLEKIRVTKVEDVTLWQRGIKFEGALHLTQHHFIFSHINQDTATSDPTKPAPKPREIWITYPMISFCTYRPSHPPSRPQPSIRLRCRDFTFISFQFVAENKARDAFETIRNLTCRLGRIEKVYAFSYEAPGPERKINGWTVYNPVAEFRRQGLGEKGKTKAWRISKINAEYNFAPTYPASLVVPASISDNTIKYGGAYRSRSRIPVLSYLHPVNDCSITRSSQPLLGLRGHRSPQDEKLVSAIFSTSKSYSSSSPEPLTSASAGGGQSKVPSSTHTPSLSTKSSSNNLEAIEDATIARARNKGPEYDDEAEDQGPRLYGAQQHNLIVDARPTLNAMAMQAAGMGSENMDHYPFATKAYLGIDNIHVMRESLNKVVDALKDSDVTPLPPNRDALASSGWLKHIANMMDGAALIARQVGIHHSHVLIHCSDGWDRTGQLSALSQLCLDPYYRTIEGFIVLVEKDFVSFGHQFRLRSGFLSSEKWFEVEGESNGGNRSVSGDPPFGGGRGGGNAFGNAYLSAKGFFNKQRPKNDSRENLSAAPLADTDSTASPAGARSGSPANGEMPDGAIPIKVRETCPIFHQFLDATYQLLEQYPTRFEFNERFLRRVFYHLYSCQYGTFLYDNEQQRVEAKISHRTRSVWDYFLSRKEQFTNDKWDGGAVDDNVRGKERLLFPDIKKIKWWHELFGRTDEEMNGPVASKPVNVKAGLGSKASAETVTSAIPPSVSSASSSPAALQNMQQQQENGSPTGKTQRPFSALVRTESALTSVETANTMVAPPVPDASAAPQKESEPEPEAQPDRVTLDPLGAGVEVNGFVSHARANGHAAVNAVNDDGLTKAMMNADLEGNSPLTEKGQTAAAGNNPAMEELQMS
ncbi:MAG: hypothetical protein M1831_000263 [Alyxoria varia]|nr:MAG: hypothetical protein M1831_000263 [Alyxoria varia]